MAALLSPFDGQENQGWERLSPLPKCTSQEVVELALELYLPAQHPEPFPSSCSNEPMVASTLLWGLPEAQDKKVALFSPLSHSADSLASFFQFPITFQLCLKLIFFPLKFFLIRSAVEYRLWNNNAKCSPCCCSISCLLSSMETLAWVYVSFWKKPLFTLLLFL